MQFFPSRSDARIDRRRLYRKIIQENITSINGQISQVSASAAHEQIVFTSTASDRGQTTNWTSVRWFSAHLISTPVCKAVDSFQSAQEFVRKAGNSTYVHMPLELMISDFFSSFLGRGALDYPPRSSCQSVPMSDTEDQQTIQIMVGPLPTATALDPKTTNFHLLPGAASENSRSSSILSNYSRSTAESKHLSSESVSYGTYMYPCSPPVSTVPADDLSPILHSSRAALPSEVRYVGPIAKSSGQAIETNSLTISNQASILSADARSPTFLYQETRLCVSQPHATKSVLVKDLTKARTEKLRHRAQRIIDGFTASALTQELKYRESRNYNRNLTAGFSTCGR